MTAAEFAAEISVKEATLRHWKWALDREAREPGWEAAVARRRRRERSAQFVELVTKAAPGVDGVEVPEPFELVFADGLRVRVPAQFDAASLRRMLAALKGNG